MFSLLLKDLNFLLLLQCSKLAGDTFIFNLFCFLSVFFFRIILFGLVSLDYQRSLAELDEICPGLPKCDCNIATTIVYCRNKTFSSIPQIPRTARRLHLEDNDISRIPARGFANLFALTDLFLTNNKIVDIGPNAFKNLTNLKYIGLAGNQLSRLDNNSFANIPNLQRLNLFNNRINIIAPNAFNRTSNILEFDLEANHLAHIPALGHQPRLKELDLHRNVIVNVTFPTSYRTTSGEIGIDLSSNKIDIIQNASFNSLRNTNLTYLHLSDNKIKYVESGAFSQVSAIMALRLKHNPLTRQALQNIAFGLSGKPRMSLDVSGIFYTNEQLQIFLCSFRSISLKLLRLRENHITALTDGMFKEIGQLRELDMAKNKIASVQESSFEGVTGLITLNLVDNELENIPKGLPPSLQQLYLNKNKLSEIKMDDFTHLLKLRRLILRDNQIVNLENGAFNGLTGLRKLDLAANKIKQIPGKLFKPLRNLTHLDISKNKLESIRFLRNRFKSLCSLRVFNMADNLCSYVQPNIFQSMKYLEILNLAKNKLGCLFTGKGAETTFKGLKHLKEIYITNNNLDTISEAAFNDQTELQVLKVDGNKISHFSPNLFRFTKSLKSLDLSQNKISVLTKDNMKYLQNLQNLNLAKNQFSCDCALRWFRDWMDRTNVVLLNSEEYRCNGPKEWRGKRLLDFNRSKIDCSFFSKYDIIGTTLAGIACTLLAVTCVYRNRWRLRLRLYLISKRGKHFVRNIRGENQYRNYGTINDDGTRYDAYVSCSEYDKPWALQRLLPGIDNGQLNDDTPFGGDFKLYYDDRDSEAGMYASVSI